MANYSHQTPLRKKQLYNEACASNLASDWSAYSDFKKYTEHECRRTRNHYLKHLLNPDSGQDHKRLWTYNYYKNNKKL